MDKLKARFMEAGLRGLCRMAGAARDREALAQLAPAYLEAAKASYPEMPKDWVKWSETATKEGPRRIPGLLGGKATD